MPVFSVITLSFQEWQITRSPEPLGYVGLENYLRAFADVDFWNSVIVTFWYTVITVFLSVAIGLFCAIVLQRTNWASSIIDTSKPDEDLLKGLSKNHKRSVKKASKLGLTTRVCVTEDEVRRFNEIYCSMYKVRGENIDRESNLTDYLRLLNFFKQTGNGFFYGVFDEDEMIGGMIIIKQGKYGFYHHSASDPEKRKLPVLHSAVFSVLDELRSRGIRYFDFGGYNHMVDETDQVYNINRFKDGFTKQYTYYPKLMYFEFKPNAVRLLELTQSLKNAVKKIVRR